MKYRFDREVRKVFAGELRKASWLMGGLITAAGFVANKLNSLIDTMLAWSILQALALLLLAMRDDEDDDKGSRE